MKKNLSSLFWVFALLTLIVSGCIPLTSTEITPAPTLESNSIPPLDVEELAPLEGEDVLVSIYERVNPGVVSIITYRDGTYFAQGSGFVLNADGNILTNFHVIEDAAEIEVIFSNAYRSMASLVGTDLDSDIAVIQVEVPDAQLNPLPLGNSTDIKVGQSVVAIGNPYGLSGTMTVGIVSAKGRLLDSLRDSTSGYFFSSADLIQTDAAINPGNSGGPLLNLRGEVVGINRAIRTNGDSTTGVLENSGIGFAVPIDIVKNVTPFLIRDGVYNYPYLGILSRQSLTLAERTAIGLAPDARGAYVLEVPNGSPADKAGLIGGSVETIYPNLTAGGDFIIAVDGNPIQNFSDLLTYLVTHKIPGDELVVTIIRDGEELEIPITLGLRPN
jgi:2-alkenal reductase